MARAHSQFVCQQCGYSQVGWSGKCPNCDSWGSLVETVVSTNTKHETRSTKQIQKPKNLSSIKISKHSHISTKISEFDRALGGGIVPGQVILLAGEPGVGKSTILLQMAEKLKNVLYVSGEESANQIAIRAKRLRITNEELRIMEATEIDEVIDFAKSENTSLGALIVDSIQTMTTSDLSGMAGSVGQVREATYRLVRFAKSNQTPVFIVGHITKEGSFAGPAVLAHLVDTVLWFEGDKQSSLRLVRAVKNRFGPTDEVGIFLMEELGLTGVADGSSLFLTTGKVDQPGSATTCVLEGTRPIMVEIQSLIVPTKLAFPRRIAQGIDSRRLEVILAVLNRRCRIDLNGHDVFINVAGGMKIKDTGADLAVALSIASSYFNKPLGGKAFAVGEVGLLGEVRKSSMEEKRLKEARRMGYRTLTKQGQEYVSEVVKSVFK